MNHQSKKINSQNKEEKKYINNCWEFSRSKIEFNSSSEKESWVCIHCSRSIAVSSYRGKRNDTRLFEPCLCKKS